MKISELRKIVKQVISEAGVSGVIGGHSGRKGQDVDDYAAGPFRPDDTLLEPLESQIKETQEKRSKIKPNPVQRWVKAHIKLDYDKVPSYAGTEFANESNDMKSIDIDHGFDEVAPVYADTKTYVNDTNDFKIIGESKVGKHTDNLRKIIREVMTEISGTKGGGGATQQARQKSADVSKFKTDVSDKKEKYDVSVDDYNTMDGKYRDSIANEPSKTIDSTTKYTRQSDSSTQDMVKGKYPKYSWTINKSSAHKGVKSFVGGEIDYKTAQNTLTKLHGKSAILGKRLENSPVKDTNPKHTTWEKENKELSGNRTAALGGMNTAKDNLKTSMKRLEKALASEEDSFRKQDAGGGGKGATGTRGAATRSSGIGKGKSTRGKKSSRAGGGARAGGISKAALSGMKSAPKGEKNKGDDGKDDEIKNESIKRGNTMKIKKSRIREIIREEIKSFREISTTGTADQKAKEQAVQNAQTDFESSRSDYETSQTAYNKAKSDLDASLKSEPKGKDQLGKEVVAQYQAPKKGGGYMYSNTVAKGYSANPAYSTWTKSNSAVQNSFDKAESALAISKADYEQAEDSYKQARRRADRPDDESHDNVQSDYGSSGTSDTVSGGDLSPGKKGKKGKKGKDDDEKNESLSSIARKILSKKRG